jgi:5,10-methenyltetrahydromethanopterin hydrogenase
MRPGNLAEPEDLNELLPLLTDSKENIPNKTTELREAINYADMVVQYVNDGSGTHDLIEKAFNRLTEARKTVNK